MNSKCLISLLLGVSVLGHANTILTLDPPVQTMEVGSVTTVNVAITSNATLFGFQLDVLFPTFLNVLSDPEEQGFFLANGCCFSPGIADNTSGVISFIFDAIAGLDGLNGPDLLLTIPFTAIAPGTGEITLRNILLSDGNGAEVPIDAIGFSEVTVTPAPEPGSSVLIGIGIGAAALLSRHRQRGPSGERPDLAEQTPRRTYR
jgi:hypothetical protein